MLSKTVLLSEIMADPSHSLDAKHYVIADAQDATKRDPLAAVERTRLAGDSTGQVAEELNDAADELRDIASALDPKTAEFEAGRIGAVIMDLDDLEDRARELGK